MPVALLGRVGTKAHSPASTCMFEWLSRCSPVAGGTSLLGVDQRRTCGPSGGWQPKACLGRTPSSASLLTGGSSAPLFRHHRQWRLGALLGPGHDDRVRTISPDQKKDGGLPGAAFGGN